MWIQRTIEGLQLSLIYGHLISWYCVRHGCSGGEVGLALCVCRNWAVDHCRSFFSGRRSCVRHGCFDYDPEPAMAFICKASWSHTRGMDFTDIAQDGHRFLRLWWKLSCPTSLWIRSVRLSVSRSKLGEGQSRATTSSLSKLDRGDEHPICLLRS